MKTSTLTVTTALAAIGASASPFISTPGPSRHAKRANTPTPLTFEIVGNSGVSAQMMFNPGVGPWVYILDKTENNPMNVTGQYGTHAAWGTKYNWQTNEVEAMDVDSNTFCAGGAPLANGTWAIFGGNQPVTTGGVATTGQAVYKDTDGGTAIRMLSPDVAGTAEYVQGSQPFNKADGDTGGWLQMTGRRWYPTIEPLEDGSLIVIGGDKNGGYVNTAAQDNPTIEFFPPKGDGNAVSLPWLSETLPVNLYALTWMLPSGKLFMQANRSTILYDWHKDSYTYLADMPYAVRVYPASAATAMMPLTPANNYTATILFCGGSNPPQWGDDGSSRYNVTAIPADNTCVRISPDAANPKYEDDDFLHQGRSMGSFAYLPDGTLWMGNGVAMGTAGYGDDMWSVGESYGQAPIYTPGLYDPSKPKGYRWSFDLAASTEERMYHSTVVLLADGSLMISGSNPNKDYTTAQWGTKYSVERWYPSWFNEERPGTAGFPSTLSYGGSYWEIKLNTTDETVVKSAKVNVVRGGFSTHAMSMGQRFLELSTSYTIDTDTNTTTLHVSQMPPNAALFQPGPAMMFLVLDGVPSWGEYVIVGSGSIGTQPTAAAEALPDSSVLVTASSNTASATESVQTASATSVSQNAKSGAVSMAASSRMVLSTVLGLCLLSLLA